MTCWCWLSITSHPSRPHRSIWHRGPPLPWPGSHHTSRTEWSMCPWEVLSQTRTMSLVVSLKDQSLAPSSSLCTCYMISRHGISFHCTLMTPNSTSEPTQPPLQPYPHFPPAWRRWTLHLTFEAHIKHLQDLLLPPQELFPKKTLNVLVHGLRIIMSLCLISGLFLRRHIPVPRLFWSEWGYLLWAALNGVHSPPKQLQYWAWPLSTAPGGLHSEAAMKYIKK